MNPSTLLGTSPAGLRRSERGITLLELLIAMSLLGVVFVAAIAVQISSLGFLRGQLNAPEVNAAIAFEQMVRDVKRANDVAVSDPNGSSLNQQLKLRIDTLVPPDASLTGDRWIVYGFVGGKLRSKTHTSDATGPASDAPSVTASDPEVLSGLSVAAASSFALMDPSGTGTSIQVKISLTVQGEGTKTVSFSTTILPSISK